MRIIAVCFLIAAWLPVSAQDAETSPELVPLAERWDEAYFGQHPAKLLVDPQRLFRDQEARKQLEFLEYHSADSAIDLCVLLFKGDQLLPGEQVGEFVRAWYADGKPTVLVLYPMGQPQRAELRLSMGLRGVVPPAEQQRALETAAERALGEASPQEQFEKFVVQMAIRIYRMERLLEDGTAGPAPVAQEIAPRGVSAQPRGAGAGQLLLEFWRVWRLQIVSGLALLLVGTWWLRRSRRRARHHFPESDCEERLAGPHGAGVGAMISFSKSSPPPAAQREKI